MSMSGDKKEEVVVFVSGCFDILHGGHIEFFEEARSLGTKLVLHIAGDESLWTHKHRNPSLPIDHKIRLYSELSMVDEVQFTKDDDFLQHNTTLGLDFEKNFLRTKPDILAVTEDDRYETVKRELCSKIGCKYVILGKTISVKLSTPISTTEIVNKLQAPTWCPLRVDFGGGWLDVPKFSRPDGFIVNCSVIPGVSLRDWNGYKKGSGLGGSGAYAILRGLNGVQSELDMNVGWQDPAIIQDTGLCVWKSGKWPSLYMKRNPCIENTPLCLMGKMALLWSGKLYSTPDGVEQKRDLSMVHKAGLIGKEAVEENSFKKLCECIKVSYQMQLEEGLKPLPDTEFEICKKYCGSGGYSCYLFETKGKRDVFVFEMKKGGEEVKIIEPYIRMNRSKKEEEEVIRVGYK